jgi:ligand-binding SRPBCC domain-containing protein
MKYVFEYESTIAKSAGAVFAFHERPDALQLLIPPGEPIKILEHIGGIQNGARVVLQMGYWPFAIRWVARHQGYVEGRQFQDVQERGPFKSWEHTHTVVPAAACCCKLIDHIEYELPFGWLGGLGRSFVERQLRKTFEYRHRTTAMYTQKE